MTNSSTPRQHAPSEDSYIDVAGSVGGSSPPQSTAAPLLAPGLRPLTITSQLASVDIPVQAQPYDYWITAEVVRKDFQRHLQLQEVDSAQSQLELAAGDDQDDESGALKLAKIEVAKREAQLTLAATFLGFLAAKVASFDATNAQQLQQHIGVLQSTWAFFAVSFLPDTDIHAVAGKLDKDVRTNVLRDYYQALVVLSDAGKLEPQPRSPKLFDLVDHNQAKVFALFGGQGNNEVYFEELQALYDAYRPIVAPSLEAASQVLQSLAEEAVLDGFSSYYIHGMDVHGWLVGTTPRPPTSYLASVPLSLPLIGLTQLVQYLVSCRASNLTPGEFRARVQGSTGHSQGIVSAIVLAASDSYESFDANVAKALGLLFHIGKRGQETFPSLSIEPAIVNDSIEGGEGEPTPMLSVTGLLQPALEKHIKSTNQHLEPSSQLAISLFNGPKNFIVTGPPRALFGLVGSLRANRAESGADQSKIPHSKRKPVFNMRFLPVGVPYHSQYLEGATSKVLEQDYKGASVWSPADLKTAVLNTEDGADMRSYSADKDLVESLCDQIFTKHIYWSRATNLDSSFTHAIDFGTGGQSGIGSLTIRNLEGRGIRMIVPSGLHLNSHELYDVKSVNFEQRWIDVWQPKLVKTNEGELKIDTPFSRLLGKPPIMVAGMTPCTVPADFNAAVINAGFHIELAGGGHYNPKALRSKLITIQNQVEPGQGQTLNALYINQRQWGFQFPQWLEMRKEGLPLQGFCVAAGVPSVEKAREILDGLREAGIQHVSFKPGSVDGIRQVCNIAAANPDFPIILQWTGGRAGGHHSCEDFHQPILSTYGSIRKQHNISLVAGSGFGGAEDFWPYLTGDWSMEYGVEPMPFDGVLFASRVMTALEAKTSTPIKQLIVDAPGVTDAEWEGTYERETGGIITVTSELGEPIHKIATRGVKLWAELDKVLFPLPKDKRLAWLSEKRDYIVGRLNKDFQKPWFPEHLDGRVAYTVADLTYEEVTRRLLRLLYVSHQQRWIDPSFRTLMGDWLRRVEERFAGIDSTGAGGAGDRKKLSVLQSYTSLDENPAKLIDGFFDEYPQARSQWLAAEDVGHFIALCQRPGQKPVPFIPVLDEHFQTWFKKDSLWQAEDLDAVFDQDPQRVCVLQGPIACRHAKKVNEPIKELLGGVETGLISKLLDRYYGGDASKVPVVDYLALSPAPLDPSAFAAQYGIEVRSEKTASGTMSTVTLGSQVPPTEAWLDFLAGPRVSWLRALLRNVSIVQGSSYTKNPIARVFAPRAKQTVEITADATGNTTSVAVRGAARSYGQHDDDFLAVRLSKQASSPLIDVTLFEERQGESIPLHLQYKYRPDQPFAPIHESVDGRNDRIKSFYWRLWFDAELPSSADLAARSEHVSPTKTLDAAAVQRFCQIVENKNSAFQRGEQAPLDFAIVAGWEAIMQALMSSSDADLLSLVHLSNSFRVLPGAKPLRAGDVCNATAAVKSVKISDTGKSVAVSGTVYRKEEDGEFKPAIEVVSSFFFRGRFNDFSTCFESSTDEYAIEIKGKAEASVLMSKEWLSWTAPAPLEPGTLLHFRVSSQMRFKDATSFAAVDIVGGVFVKDYKDEMIRVADIEYTADGISYGNPVIEYVKRNGGNAHGPVDLDNGYSLASAEISTVFTPPRTNEPYSKASGDYNPIHINPYFSDFAALPGTITHGLFSSAATRKFVENIAAEGHPERCLSFDASFTGMVLPGDVLTVKLRHVAMRGGNKVIKVETFNQRDEKVIDASAEVSQPPTVYVFTGQGSQEQGMGMELYNSSETAKALWDEADSHLRDSMGFSILEIINQNPMTKTVHFGGVRGHAIRERYMAMAFESTDEKGEAVTLPLFPEITAGSQSYTFQSPKGLLFATQFAQIALVLVELSAFQDMKQRGLIKPDAAFAGHSLGEYASLAAVASVLHVKDLVDVVFYRGLTMQRAVQRDEEGRSNYGMMACNPSRIGPSFNDTAFNEVIDSVGRESGRLIQVVNMNVQGQQLVVAGELITLLTLGNVLNYIKLQKIDLKKLQEIMSLEEVREKLALIVRDVYGAAQAEAAKGPIQLQRGFATIPLPGIDVPFHSRYLTGGVAPFRHYLSRRINVESISPRSLTGRYIPNLVAKPFELSKEYAQLIFDQTDSPRLSKVLQNWERDGWGTIEREQRLTTTLVVELLAYQFASPVRWIETQDIIFTPPYDFERLVEFGPSPTLVGMAGRTHKLKYAVADQARGKRRVMLCHSKDKDAIYYAFADEEGGEEAAPAATAEPAAAVAQAPVAVAAPTSVAAPSGGAAAADVPDAPLKATETVRAILAQKLKKPIAEIPLSKAIKDMVGGKSTLQNELVGDLQLEFGNLPERGEELPLGELGAGLDAGYSGALGKHTAGLVSRMVGAKLPGGFNLSSLKSHLTKAWGLGTGRTDGVLLVALTMEPAKRLGSEPEAKAWIDSVVATYAASSGISLSQGGAGGGSGSGGGGGATISSEELDKLQARNDEHTRRQIQVMERYLGQDGRAGGRLAEATKAELEAAQAKLDAIALEHGEVYTNGILPRFDALKARHFTSYWNWSRQDAMVMFYDIIYGRLTAVDREITARCITIMNRADPIMIDYMQYYIDNVDTTAGPTYQLAKEFGQMLIENCREAVNSPAAYKEVHAPTAPKTEIDAKGNIVYTEAKRVGVRKLEAYVKEMAAGTRVGPQVNVDKAQENITKLWTLIRNEPAVSKLGKATIKSLYGEVVRSLGQPKQSRFGSRVPRNRRLSSNVAARPVVPNETFSLAEDREPYLHIKRSVGGSWQTSQKLTSVYMTLLTEMATSGVSFKNQNALLTGVGKGSIGVEVVRGLLAGGARLVITTSSYSRKTVEYYQRIYQEVGSRGSALTVVPFNAGSKQDIDSLITYIYDTLNLDLDFVLPFAAISENGRQIDGIDDKSELAHRAMLTNVVRLLGAIKTKKAATHSVTRPTLVVLPLSPNHGVFGSDGLYSESKIALETLFNRWRSEGWSDYLSISGAVIGWCRGTGLMEANNIVAESLEKLGLRTFSSTEMAFNILGLLHPVLFAQSQIEPICADLGGGFARVADLAEKTAEIRATIQEEAAKRRAISIEAAADFKIIRGAAAEALHQTVQIEPRAQFDFRYPELGPHADMRALAKLDSPIDLNKVVVITGFGEVGPWGSARTRWEQEARGSFTIEGCIELAWTMGMIRHLNGKLKNGKTYVGWVDSKTEEPIEDKDVRARYEKEILEHTGVRFIEPELFRGYDPKRKGFMQEIELNHDLEPLEVTAAEAAKFKLEQGDHVDTWEDSSAGTSFVTLKKGARIIVPKAVSFDRLVAGQIPTGWSAGRYGIPDDIAAQVDRTTLWALVCTAEALANSGVSDPYELYKYVHPSQVGTAIGSGMGGVTSLSRMFRDRRSEADVQKDILQETFINTTAGWINLLLMSSCGPVKVPVGACATAGQSIEISAETILSGKAKVMLAGGFDDLSEEGSFEFANMQATSNAQAELAAGREPSEMSRPTTSTRSGFMESQGAGVQVLMSAATALEMGAPIRGIVAYASTHTDKQGRSIPAPGHGVLSAAVPFQRALASWGLTADDIGAISCHGTSTKANDKNESHVYHEMFKKIGRSPAHAVPVMAQKWLVGHSKGGAAAWALNGVLQSLESSMVAGNRNADDISPELRKFTYLLYNSTTIHRTPKDLNVAMLTSFGFGQTSVVLGILHPAHLLGRLSETDYEAYKTTRRSRQAKTYMHLHSALTSNNLIRVKEAPPYSAELEDIVLLNTNARAKESKGSYAFIPPFAAEPALISTTLAAKPLKTGEVLAQQQALESTIGQVAGVGIDCEKVSEFPSDNETFIDRNFTADEIAYCRAQPNPQASFAAKWAAAEAVFKALGVASQGAAASLKEIEIVSTPTGPQVKLTGEALKAANGSRFLLSITHDDLAIAIAHRIPAAL